MLYGFPTLGHTQKLLEYLGVLHLISCIIVYLRIADKMIPVGGADKYLSEKYPTEAVVGTIG